MMSMYLLQSAPNRESIATALVQSVIPGVSYTREFAPLRRAHSRYMDNPYRAENGGAERQNALVRPRHGRHVRAAVRVPVVLARADRLSGNTSKLHEQQHG